MHELDRVRQWLEDDEPHRAQHTLKRILSIVKVMVAQLDILETDDATRNSSRSARGSRRRAAFKSDQFRQIEFVLGVKSQGAIRRFPEDSRARVALERRYREPTLWDGFLRYLSREEARRTAIASRTGCVRADRAFVGGAADSPRRLPGRPEERRAVLRACWSISDEGIQEWRYRACEDGGADDWHQAWDSAAPPVRLTCGKQVGRPLFPDLWRSGRSCKSRMARTALARKGDVSDVVKRGTRVESALSLTYPFEPCF